MLARRGETKPREEAAPPRGLGLSGAAKADRGRRLLRSCRESLAGLPLWGVGGSKSLQTPMGGMSRVLRRRAGLTLNPPTTGAPAATKRA